MTWCSSHVHNLLRFVCCNDVVFVPFQKWRQPNSASFHSDSGRSTPQDSLAFFHIPTLEWEEAARGPKVGQQFESIYAPDVNSGLLTEMRTTGGVRAISVGHDHVNDFCGVWQGIHLCYGGGIGYTTYGLRGWPRRARVFEVSCFLKGVHRWSARLTAMPPGNMFLGLRRRSHCDVETSG